MALDAPDYFAGSEDPLKGADVLFKHSGWIRRRCNEILAELQLDAIKLYGLASHCLLYRLEADKWIAAGEVTRVLNELVRLTQAGGSRNSLKTPADIELDYRQLYVAAGVHLTWSTANLPAVGQAIPNAVVTVNRTWPNSDLIVRVPKPAAVQAAVQALRDVFL